MNILVIGAGGTGGCIGGYLAKQGEKVTLIARGEHLAAIQRDGLRVKSARIGDFTVHPPAFTTESYPADRLPAPDVIFVCVKAYSLPSILPFLQLVAAPETVVVPLLNVFGAGRQLQESLSAAVTDGCMYIYAMIEKSGVITQPTAIFRVLYGFRHDQSHTGAAVLQQLETVLKNSGIDASFTPDIEREALLKFSFVSPLGAAGYFYGAPCGAFWEAGEKQTFFLSLVREIAALGKAMGLELPADLPERNLALLRDMEPEGVTSMLRDIQSGRPSEFDGLVARVPRLCRTYGVACPAYDRVVQKAQAG